MLGCLPVGPDPVHHKHTVVNKFCPAEDSPVAGQCYAEDRAHSGTPVTHWHGDGQSWYYDVVHTPELLGRVIVKPGYCPPSDVKPVYVEGDADLHLACRRGWINESIG